MKNQTLQQIGTLIRSYQSLGNGAKAELRKLESYRVVPEQAPSAYYRVKEQYYRQFPWLFCKNFETVTATLLLFWRDRKAKEELKIDKQELGTLMVGDGKNCPVKINRFKRIMRAETLDEGFHALRPVLQLFRHDDVNWVEVASLISAWKQHEENHSDSLYICKKNLADAYYSSYQFNSNA